MTKKFQALFLIVGFLLTSSEELRAQDVSNVKAQAEAPAPSGFDKGALSTRQTQAAALVENRNAAVPVSTASVTQAAPVAQQAPSTTSANAAPAKAAADLSRQLLEFGSASALSPAAAKTSSADPLAAPPIPTLTQEVALPAAAVTPAMNYLKKEALTFSIDQGFANGMIANGDWTGLQRVIDTLKSFGSKYEVYVNLSPAQKDPIKLGQALDLLVKNGIHFVLDVQSSDTLTLGSNGTINPFDVQHGRTLSMSDLQSYKDKYGELFAGVRMFEVFAENFTVEACQQAGASWCADGGFDKNLPTDNFFQKQYLEDYAKFSQDNGMFLMFSDWFWSAYHPDNFTQTTLKQNQNEADLLDVINRYKGTIVTMFANNEPDELSRTKKNSWQKLFTPATAAGSAGFGLSNQSWMCANPSQCPVGEMVDWTLNAFNSGAKMVQFEPSWYWWDLPTGQYEEHQYVNDARWDTRGFAGANLFELAKGLGVTLPTQTATLKNVDGSVRGTLIASGDGTRRDTYDTQGRLQMSFNPKTGVMTHIQYAANGKDIAGTDVVTADGSRIDSYDKSGKLQTSYDVKTGQMTQILYNSAGVRIGTKIVAASSAPLRTVTLKDANGTVSGSQITSAVGRRDTYDAFGKLVMSLDLLTGATTYLKYSKGIVSEITVTNANRSRIDTYEPTGKLKTSYDANTGSMTYVSYGPDGKPVSYKVVSSKGSLVTSADGTQKSFYDPAGKLQYTDNATTGIRTDVKYNTDGSLKGYLLTSATAGIKSFYDAAWKIQYTDNLKTGIHSDIFYDSAGNFLGTLVTSADKSHSDFYDPTGKLIPGWTRPS